MKSRITGAIAAIALTANAAWGAPTPAQKCQAARYQALEKYVTCVAKMQKLTYDPFGPNNFSTEDYRKVYYECGDKLATAWGKANFKAQQAGATCPEAPLTHLQIKAFLDERIFEVVSSIAGEPLPDCTADVAACEADLAVCQSPPMTTFPATGQTTSYGAGSDGDLEFGATMSFSDNGDGTLTDDNTKLMWEKKDSVGDVHDYRNAYSWGLALSPFTMNGTVVTEFLDVLNDVAGGGANCFAGHCDWRLPTARELVTILDFSRGPSDAKVHPAFSNPAGCVACTSVTQLACSCDSKGGYLTSTTVPGLMDRVYGVRTTTIAGLTFASKDAGYARAVRGGL